MRRRIAILTTTACLLATPAVYAQDKSTTPPPTRPDAPAARQAEEAERPPAPMGETYGGGYGGMRGEDGYGGQMGGYGRTSDFGPYGGMERGYMPPDGMFGYAAPRREPQTYLGVTAVPISRTLGEQLGLPPGVGLEVTHVDPDSPAARAGVSVRDLLYRFDDQLLVNPDQLRVLVRTKTKGWTVPFEIIRKGESTTMEITLAEKMLPVQEAEVRVFPRARVFGRGEFGGGERPSDEGRDLFGIEAPEEVAEALDRVREALRHGRGAAKEALEQARERRREVELFKDGDAADRDRDAGGRARDSARKQVAPMVLRYTGDDAIITLKRLADGAYHLDTKHREGDGWLEYELTLSGEGWIERVPEPIRDRVRQMVALAEGAAEPTAADGSDARR